MNEGVFWINQPRHYNRSRNMHLVRCDEQNKNELARCKYRIPMQIQHHQRINLNGQKIPYKKQHFHNNLDWRSVVLSMLSLFFAVQKSYLGFRWTSIRRNYRGLDLSSVHRKIWSWPLLHALHKFFKRIRTTNKV